ncbi:MAG: 2-C-methyl-D-erythritol 4-phosphate cytidylyltransferase, partial [Betaproteobacteria bacterium]|nr:2-C-methyl-D-erythritol 4-phosphate cytidylyltransferase [Betaproteobacteria bacterium]
EQLGLRPRLVAGSRENLKVTYPEDLAIAEAILARRAKRA